MNTFPVWVGLALAILVAVAGFVLNFTDGVIMLASGVIMVVGIFVAILPARKGQL